MTVVSFTASGSVGSAYSIARTVRAYSLPYKSRDARHQDFGFRRQMNGQTPLVNEGWVRRAISISRSVITMRMVSFATDIFREDRDYDNWIETLTEASTRLDALQAAVTELRHLCESEDVHSEQVLEVLASHGA